MISRYQEWLNSFLEQRSLKIPDGRPVYAYLCSTEEFNEVEVLLSSAKMTVNINSSESLHCGYPGLERLFVLYCAEWWRRNYKSGPWKWQPILDAVSWPFLDHKNRTQFVEFGLRYWRRDLLRRGDHRGFLLTVACEGGLPINLVRNDTGYLRAFLRAVLRDFATYHTSGIDATELASSHLDYLPSGLRQQMVQELAGMLIEKIWELQKQLCSQHSDPVEELDRIDPGWRHKLPMVLEDEAANALVLALLRQARVIRIGKVTELHLVRRLLRNGQDWQFEAELQLPDVIDRNWLMKELGDEHSLGERLELRMSWSEKTVRVASLVQQGDEYNVYPHDRRKLHIRESADREINCFVYERGRQVGHLSLPNGSGLTEELPLIFVDREGGAQSLDFWAQGSLSSRFPEVFVLSQFKPEPLSSTSDRDEIELIAESLKVLDQERCLYRLSGEFTITLDQGMACVIRTRQTEESRSEYRFKGRRNYLVETKWPVFMGVPTVRRVQEKGGVNKVRIEELYWSKTSGKRKWQQVSQSPAGLVELRHLQNGECLFARRVIILPAEGQINLVPTDGRNKGRIELRQIGTNLVSWEDHGGVDIEKTINDDVIVLHCTAEKATHGKIRLKLRWHNGCVCDFEVPFPAEGGRFVAPDGRVLTASEYVALDNLFGYSAAALSLRGGRSFKIFGKLKGSDIDGPMHRSWHFEAPLSEVKGNLNVYELPLYELHQKLKQLFSLSSDRDAVVTLELLCSGSLEARLDVQQFVGELQFDYDSREVRIEHCDGHSELHLNESIELLPLADPEGESHHLRARDDELVWPIEQEILERGPWLAVAHEKVRSRYRPRLVAAPSQSNPTLTLQSGLGQIVAEPHEETRIQIMHRLFERMAGNLNHQEWQVLLAYVRRFVDVHPDCLDWLRVSVEYPRILIGLLLLGDSSTFEIVYELQEYLPFKWWMLPVKSWQNVIRNRLAPFEDRREVRQILIKEIKRVLQKVYERDDIFACIVEFLTQGITSDIATGALKYVRSLGTEKAWAQLEGYPLSELRRAKADSTWPTGMDRDDWRDSMDSKYVSYLRWLPMNSGFEKPVLDAPLAAAYFSITGTYPEQSERSFLTVMRDFQPDWFDTAFRAVQAILLVQFAKEVGYE